MKYKRSIFMLATHISGVTIKINNTLLNWERYSNVDVAKHIFTIFYENRR